MAYGHIGSMKATAGHRDDVISILLSGVDGLRRAGCHLYIVSAAQGDDETIWVSEVWESKKHHDASLQLPPPRLPSARRCRCLRATSPATS